VSFASGLSRRPLRQNLIRYVTRDGPTRGMVSYLYKSFHIIRLSEE
jgi:hypothetical protein